MNSPVMERHSEIWTASFSEVLRYVQDRKEAAMEIKELTTAL